MKSTGHILDNPVWHSLNEKHADFSVDYNGGKFYKPAYCSFGGFVNFNHFAASLNDYAKETNNFFVVGDIPQYRDELTIRQKLICNQMVLNKPIDQEIHEEIVALKTDTQKKELFDLVNLVQPGYFNKNTGDLGCYFGIYKNNKLIATTGERMKMNKYTEISAVVTHPEYTRKGYAKQLIKYTADTIFSENKIPYLHVLESNIGAIQLYEKLGFVTRRKISFWNFVKT